MRLHSLQQKCTILTTTALPTPWRSLPVTLLESDKAPFSILVAPSSHVEWHVHLWTNNCSPGVDFLIMHLKPMSPQCYRVWERTAFPKGVRTLVCEEWSSEHSSSSSREKCRLRPPQPHWIRIAVFTRPPVTWLRMQVWEALITLLKKGNGCWAVATGDCYTHFLVMVLNWFWLHFPLRRLQNELSSYH